MCLLQPAHPPQQISPCRVEIVITIQCAVPFQIIHDRHARAGTFRHRNRYRPIQFNHYRGIHLYQHAIERGDLYPIGVFSAGGLSMKGSNRRLYLIRAGLVTRGRVAQARPASLSAEPMKQVAEWAAQFREFWDQRYDRLDDYLRTMPDEPEDHS